MRARRSTAALVAVLALAPQTARGEPGTSADTQASADAAYERARAHFAAEEYLAAADALQEAYALDPNPSYLYQRGHALRLAGSCEAALPVFREVESLAESAAQEQEVQQWIEHCERVVEEARPQAPPTPAAAVAPDEPASAEPVAEPIAPDRAPVRRDVLGGVSVGVGAVLALAGSGMLVGAAALANQPSGEPEIEYEQRGDRVRQLEITGAVVLGVGAAALVTGVVRYAVLARRRREVAGRVPGVLTVRF